MPDQKTVSKKGTVGGAGLAIIAGCPDFRTQIILAVVVIAYIVSQTVLDLKGAAK